MALAVAIVSLTLPASAGAYIYWSNSGTNTIARANLDGSQVNERFITDGVNGPRGVAVDSHYIYYAMYNTGAIARASLDGSGPPNTSFIVGAQKPDSLAIHGNYIYWANSTTNTIGRANIYASPTAGEDVNQNFIAGANGLGGIAVDDYYIYWANFFAHTIERTSLDGTVTGNLITLPAGSSLRGVAVDANHVYWADDNHFEIGRADLGGGSVDTGYVTGIRSPFGVAVDSQHLYWTDAANGTIGRADFQPNDNFITGASDPLYVAVDSLGPPPQTAPHVTTAQAVSVAPSSARLTGTVNPGGATVSDCHVEYGTSTSYTNIVPCAQAVGGGNAPVSVSAGVSGLQPATTYHFRLVAVNTLGTGYGTDRAFTTSAPAAPGTPLVTTGAASAVTLTTATLNGTVDPRGRATTYHFDYGTSTAYGTSLPAPNASAGSDSTTHAVFERISGLAPGTRYHFRIVATSGRGTTDGADVTFTTGAPNPKVGAPALSGLGISPSRLHAASRGASVALAKRNQIGATISYRDSARARATFTVERQVSGVRSGRRCVAFRGRADKHARRCLLTVSLGSFAHADRPGANRVRFTGRLSGRKLRPGRYILQVFATNAGGNSKPLHAKFTIL